MKNNTLKHINFEITSKCNQKCIYCFNAYRRENINDLSLHEIKKILLDLKKKDIKSMLFTGGEPFSRNDMMQVLELSLDMGFDTSVLSNGFKIGTLVEQNKKVFNHLNTIQISLDTLNEKKLNEVRKYDKAHSDAVSALKVLVDNDIKNVEISSVFNKNNKEDLFEVAKFVYDNKIKLILRSLYSENNDIALAKEYNDFVTKIKMRYPNILIEDKFFYVTDSNFTINSEGKFIKEVA